MSEGLQIHPLAGGLDGFTISWNGSWLPGRYADHPACLVAYGVVLGGERRFSLEFVRDAHAGDLITVADLERAAGA